MARHKWSGWPGAICLKCFNEDALEIALADGWYDCYPDDDGNPVETWDTEEHRELVREVNGNCSVEDVAEEICTK